MMLALMMMNDRNNADMFTSTSAAIAAIAGLAGGLAAAAVVAGGLFTGLAAAGLAASAQRISENQAHQQHDDQKHVSEPSSQITLDHAPSSVAEEGIQQVVSRPVDANAREITNALTNYSRVSEDNTMFSAEQPVVPVLPGQIDEHVAKPTPDDPAPVLLLPFDKFPDYVPRRD